VEKIANITTTAFYPVPHYEVENGEVVKYYFFNGQRIAMRRGSTLTYLHPDHLGSTVLSTTSSGAADVAQGYHGYGKYRLGSVLPTDHRFTGQKLDATGLMYYGARYYDRHIGTFVSPRQRAPGSCPTPPDSANMPQPLEKCAQWGRIV
jgi:RHS repeat-associated protein